MKRIVIAVFAVLALAFANPAATSADKPDDPGQSEVKKQDKDSCKKKSCGQPHGQSCKHKNVHKTWCKNGHDGDGDDDDDDNEGSSRLANTGV
jgi:hypothetical protein